MGTISNFVVAFQRDRPQYETIEKEIEILCRTALRGIESLWQSRVKSATSLEDKLRARNDKYENESANVADACDLIGGRIILARLLDIEKVERILKEIFSLRSRSQHPKPGRDIGNLQARFRGYDGLHFYVTRRGPSSIRLPELVIEIQVMSPFMWGFIMLDHDIRYKESHGEPTEEILLSLQLLQGIANLGEIAQQIFDNDLWLMTKGSSQQSEQSGIGIALQSTLQSVTAKVELDENDKKCLRDLRRTDPRYDKQRIETDKDGLLEGSCSWVLEDPAFVGWWTRDDSRLLWIHGDPGKGKTMMMIALISEVSKRLNDRPGSNVLAYFFCQNNDRAFSTAISVLRGLIYHFVDQEKRLLRHVRKRYDSAGKQLFEDINALYALQDIFLDILKDPSLGNFYFMIDGLDECDPSILELLKWILRNSGTSLKIKWLFTSRNELAFIERLGTDQHLHISLETNSEQVTRVVTNFIDHKISELVALKSYTSELHVFVRKSLLEKAEGTFLWVALVCQELSSVPQLDAKSLLEKTPSGLEPLYERMLDQVLHQKYEDRVERCRRILRLVTLAFRPLRLEEIAVFAKIPKSDLKDLVSYCGSFVAVRDETVYLIHQSAKDYLSDGKGNSIFHSGWKDEHANISRLCLEVMSTTLKKDMSRVAASLPSHVRYACRYWVDHLRRASPAKQESLLMHKSCQYHEFLREHFLHLVEALILMDTPQNTIIDRIQLDPIPNFRMSAKLTSFMDDASNFIRTWWFMIEKEPLHLYTSALLFSPKTSIVKCLFSRELPRWIERSPIVGKDWTSDSRLPIDNLTRVSAVVFSPDSQLVASASRDRTVRLWDSATGVLCNTLEGHSDWVNAVVFSPDGRLLASASKDKTVRLWDVKAGIATRQLEHDFSGNLSFSPDGSQLEIDGRLVTVSSSSLNSPPITKGSANTPPLISVKWYWIMYRNHTILWLSRELLTATYAYQNNTLVLGHLYGGVTFLHFSPTFTPPVPED